jgi:hypothetical protein
MEIVSRSETWSVENGKIKSFRSVGTFGDVELMAILWVNLNQREGRGCQCETQAQRAPAEEGFIRHE